MSSEFKGKVCVVTGGSSGIGLATAARFAEEGAEVIVCARDKARLAAAAESLRASGGTIHEHVLDVSDSQAVERFMGVIAARHAGVHVLVNNAFSQIGGTVAATSIKEWHDNFGATLHGALYMTHGIIPLMRKVGGGAIVNVSSVSGVVVTPGTAGYASAKAGLQQLTRVVAVEEAKYGIRANAIIVGGVDTPALKKTIPDGYDNFAKLVPVGRVGMPAEVANVIRFLASSQASYVTASLLLVDGGLTAAMGHGIDQSQFKSSEVSKA
jgi:meso-butanediol dehydrogenase/(S,S)-butanediol dehydrogenase/diacetyl reductase